MTSGALRATANSSSDFCLPPPKTLQPASRIAGAMRIKALRIFIHSFRRLLPKQESAEQQDDDANANRRVADIKDIKGPPATKMQVEEVDHIAELHPIDDIPQRAAEDHCQGQLVAAHLFLANPPGDADGNGGGDSDQDPALGVAGRLGEAEADAVIMDPGEVEDRDELQLLALDHQAKRAVDKPFAQLVGCEDGEGEQVGGGSAVHAVLRPSC